MHETELVRAYIERYAICREDGGISHYEARKNALEDVKALLGHLPSNKVIGVAAKIERLAKEEIV